MLGYKGDILPSSRSLSKRGTGCVDNFPADFSIKFLRPLFRNLLSSVRNSTVCLGQELKQFSFWSYFLVVSCEEFAVAVNSFLISFELSSVVPFC